MYDRERCSVRSLALANYLTTVKGYKIRSVRDGRGKYKVFYFDNSTGVQEAINEWVTRREKERYEWIDRFCCTRTSRH